MGAMFLFNLIPDQPSLVSPLIIFVIVLVIPVFLLIYFVNRPKKNYWGNGKLKSKEKFKNGRRNGIFKYYHYNGRLKSEGNFKNDKKDGTIKHYHDNGQLSLEEKWKNGKNVGPNNSYDEKGKLVSKKKSTKNQPKDYEEQYEKEIEEIFLSTESMANEYEFVTFCYSLRLNGEKFTEEDFTEIIIKHHRKFNSKTLSGKQGIYQNISQLTGQWINLIEKEDKIKFKGTESFEQYNSISQYIYNVLTTELISRAVKGEKFE